MPSKRGLSIVVNSDVELQTKNTSDSFEHQGPVSRSLLKIKVTLNSRISLIFSLL